MSENNKSEYVIGEKIPVAIAISEALEVIDKNEKLFIGLDTFVLKTMSCLEDKTKVDTVKLYQDIKQDMEIIKELFKNVTFYRSPYLDIIKIKSSYVREVRTPKQKANHKILSDIVTTLTKEEHFYQRPYTTSDKPLLMTHLPVDLVPAKDNYRLLEAHTGAIKSRTEFYTKFYKIPRSNLERVPLTHSMLMIFGDSYLYKPYKLAMRRKILELASKYKWNYTTNELKISKNLYNDKEAYALYTDVINTLKKNKLYY